METQIALQNQTTSPDALPKKKVAKRRFARLSSDELRELPGANLTVQKKVETGPSYFFEIGIKLDSAIGSAVEQGQATEFLFQLQSICLEKAVGSIVNVMIAENKYQITIQIRTVGEQTSHAAPLKFVFDQLNAFFAASSLILSRKPVWKFKVMGTTIGDGFLGG